MATIDPGMISRFAELLEETLPRGVQDTFGGEVRLTGLTLGTLPLQVLELGAGHHLHLELEMRVPGGDSRSLLLVLPAADAGRLFDLEPRSDTSLSEPDMQLIALAEFTEGAEALTNTWGPILSEHGVPAMLRVSGASLEDEDNSPLAASGPFAGSEPLAFSGQMTHGTSRFNIVVAVAPELAAAMVMGGTLDEEIAYQEPIIQMPRPVAHAAAAAGYAAPAPQPTFASPAGPRVTAHPLAFGQLEPPGMSSRMERSVDLIADVALKVRVELGSTSMTVEEVLGLSPGSVVELDRLAGEPVDIVINDRLIARGEVVVVEENFGVRVTEIVTPRQRASVTV